MAEFRERLDPSSARAKASAACRSTNDRWLAGVVPYGYSLTEDSRLVVDSEGRRRAADLRVGPQHKPTARRARAQRARISASRDGRGSARPSSAPTWYPVEDLRRRAQRALRRSRLVLPQLDVARGDVSQPSRDRDAGDVPRRTWGHRGEPAVRPARMRSTATSSAVSVACGRCATR